MLHTVDLLTQRQGLPAVDWIRHWQEEFTCSTSWWKYVYDAAGVSHVILCARKSVEQTGCGMAAKRTHTPAQKHGWMVYPQIFALWRAYLHGKLLLQMQTVKTSFGLRGQVFAVCCGRPSTSHAVVFASHVVNTHPNHLRLVTLSTTYIFNSVSAVATVVAPLWLGFLPATASKFPQVCPIAQQ